MFTRPKEMLARGGQNNQALPSTLPLGLDNNNTTTTTATMISNDKNLMPSMVVKQQKQQSTVSSSSLQTHRTTENTTSGQQRPTFRKAEEDCGKTLDEILLKTREAAEQAVTTNNGIRAGELEFDQDGLVLPRRVPHHHQQPAGLRGSNQQPATTMRDLNRELKFNQVRGLSLLDQKSELKRAMEKLESNRRRKEAEQERLTRRTSLELRLEERAQRIARESASQSGGGGGATTGEQQAAAAVASNSGVLS